MQNLSKYYFDKIIEQKRFNNMLFGKRYQKIKEIF